MTNQEINEIKKRGQTMIKTTKENYKAKLFVSKKIGAMEDGALAGLFRNILLSDVVAEVDWEQVKVLIVKHFPEITKESLDW